MTACATWLDSVKATQPLSSKSGTPAAAIHSAQLGQTTPPGRQST